MKNAKNTVHVEPQNRFDRVDYPGLNPLATKLLTLIGRKSFSEANLKAIRDLGYKVVIGRERILK